MTASACELPSMIATLHSYENTFGPYAAQTLALAIQIGRALWAEGDCHNARRLFEHCVRYLPGHGEAALSIRITALTLLRDLLSDMREYESAIAVQRELIECRLQSEGPNDPGVRSEKAGLAGMLLQNRASIHAA